MYYQEKMINGVLHYRNTPHGEWVKLSPEVLSKRVLRAEKEATMAKNLIGELYDQFTGLKNK